MAGVPLFDRDFEVIVGNIKIPARAISPSTQKSAPTLRIVFNIEKTLDSTPNKAKLTLFNLNSAHRKAVQEGWPVTVKAGYVDNTPQLFGGWIEKSDNRRDGVDWITEIEASDNGNAFRSARVNKSFGRGTTLTSVLNYLAGELGIGLGNSAQKFAESPRGLRVFKKGVSISGQVKTVLDRFVASAGYQWSIQDGILQVLTPDETVVRRAFVMTPETGLIGSPETGENGRVTAKSLLNGAIKPGIPLGFETEGVSGFYKIDKTVYTGDTWGSDWYTNFEGKPI